MDINVFLLYTGLKSFQCIKNHKIVILQKSSHMWVYIFLWQEYLKDNNREDNVFASQSDHVIQTKPVSEVVTPVSKRYTPYKLRSHS